MTTLEPNIMVQILVADQPPVTVEAEYAYPFLAITESWPPVAPPRFTVTHIGAALLSVPAPNRLLSGFARGGNVSHRRRDRPSDAHEGRRTHVLAASEPTLSLAAGGVPVKTIRGPVK